MLQQTTVAAVVPYYEKFLRLFPDLRSLARAQESAVLKAWSGLGYYSRARNLHKAARELAALPQFPRTAQELIELPGFGPYTSRAVASLAFEDPVGVLDGNVIRVLSRLEGKSLSWWTPRGREELQSVSDEFALIGFPSEINQALMELGATVCTPRSPSCLLCPWVSRCEARKKNKVEELPTKKPRKALEIWSWTAEIHLRQGRLGLVKNPQAPVLRDQWIFPGSFRRLKKKPKDFAVRHGITHHDLFVQLDNERPKKGAKLTAPEIKWVKPTELSQWNPSILLKKILEAYEKTDLQR